MSRNKEIIILEIGILIIAGMTDIAKDAFAPGI